MVVFSLLLLYSCLQRKVNDFLRFFPHSIYNGITFHNGEKIFTLPTNEYTKYNSCIFSKIAKGIKYHRPVRSTKDGTAYRKRTAVLPTARRQKQFFRRYTKRVPFSGHVFYISNGVYTLSAPAIPSSNSFSFITAKQFLNKVSADAARRMPSPSSRLSQIFREISGQPGNRPYSPPRICSMLPKSSSRVILL